MFELEEAPGVSFDDVVEVSNYVAALEHGLARLGEGFPQSNWLLREVHAQLLVRGRGTDKLPGEFRRTRNSIGGTRPGNAFFVPPPPALVEDCVAALERFIHDPTDSLPLPVKAATAHVQFETIHPLLDSNGRVDRLLIALMLHESSVLRRPLLYLSIYFKRHRDEYYRLLDTVRRDGDWETWLNFFLEGVMQTAGGAVDIAHRLLALFSEDTAHIETRGRGAGTVLQIFGARRTRPIANITDLAARTGVSYPTAAKSVESLASIDIMRELTGRCHRLFAYARYLAILNEGTEPLRVPRMDAAVVTVRTAGLTDSARGARRARCPPP